MYTGSLEGFIALLSLTAGQADTPPPPPPPPPVVAASAPAPVMPAPQITEDSPEWDCRRDGNQRCGTGYIDPDGYRHWIDFSGDVPVVSWTTDGAAVDIVEALPVPGPVQDYYPDDESSEIVDSVETDTGHRDLDAEGNLRNVSESDRDVALDNLNTRTTASIENGMCVWRNETGAVVSASTELADCGGETAAVEDIAPAPVFECVIEAVDGVTVTTGGELTENCEETS